MQGVLLVNSFSGTEEIALTLPTKYYDQPYDAFKRAMDTAMACHGGFGLV